MTELELFQYFKDNQLYGVDYLTGTIDVHVPIANQHLKKQGKAVVHNVGSRNEDGYIRIWCGSKVDASIGRKLKMRHRLIYFLYHGFIDEDLEIDHIDRVRGNDSILNLRAVSRKANCSNTKATVVRNTYDVSIILNVCQLLQDTTHSDLTIAKMVGLSRNYVRDIKKRRRQTTVSKCYSWEHRE